MTNRNMRLIEEMGRAAAALESKVAAYRLAGDNAMATACRYAAGNLRNAAKDLATVARLESEATRHD